MDDVESGEEGVDSYRQGVESGGGVWSVVERVWMM